MASKIILASASPRRRELLNQIGVAHQVLPVDIDETPRPEESPLETVTRLAKEKAIAGVDAAKIKGIDNPLVLAADTVVVHADKALGKPENQAHHCQMLEALSNSTHQVITAFSLKSGTGEYTQAVSSDVTFTALDLATIASYWQSGEPHDKAGGYAIQGYAATFVKHLSGSYTGVVGLPLYELASALKRFGVDV